MGYVSSVKGIYSEPQLHQQIMFSGNSSAESAAAEAESHPFKSMFAAASEVPEADLAVGGRGLKYVCDRAINTYTPEV